MHWAMHGYNAAKIIVERADSDKDFIGLTTFSGNYPTLTDTTIAKNYLTNKELDYFLIMNRKDILKDSGKISYKDAINYAKKEYDKYKERGLLKPNDVELHYLESIKTLEMIVTKN